MPSRRAGACVECGSGRAPAARSAGRSCGSSPRGAGSWAEAGAAPRRFHPIC
ncbi:hypothetical protein SCE1572_25310 [Sorangium cellulosum So0157-2]|uniref:Uncharacterized protein n=1 Tax=Sorangium cellulosum So0157-2 TaxID=1254432 RepID=S4Y3S3_SORCE|nr:hypothetical protein SCE1572_25310 [Sorangium cellulosum So0157-2]